MTEVVFVHERYPFGGGETVTALVAKGITYAATDVHVTVIASELDRSQVEDSTGVSHIEAPLTAESIVAQLREIAEQGVLVVPVDPPKGMLASVRSELPGWRIAFILHSEPMWQVRGKTALSPVKALRERLFKAYTRRYTRRYREIYSQVDRFCVLCDGYREPLARIVGDDSKIVAMYNPVAMNTDNIPVSTAGAEPLAGIDNIYDIRSMKNNKIAFLIPSYVGGGAERVTDTVSSALSRQYGLDPLLISTEFTSESRERAVGLGYTIEELEPADGKYYNTATTDRVIDILSRHQASILVIAVDMLKDVDRIRKALPDCNIIYHLHCSPLWEAQAKLTASRRHAKEKGSWVAMVAWWLTKYAKEKFFGAYSRRYARHYRQTYDAVDRFVVLCDAYKGEVEKIVGATSGDSHVVAMYNPLSVAGAGRAADGTSHAKTVLYVGRLSYADKRVDRLLRIWARVAPSHPDWRLKIVGDGPERKSLEAMSKNLHIDDSVEFCGYASDPSEYYREASILCLTSEFEGWGLVLVEAQAAGVWPMAFGCSAGVCEILGNDNTRGTSVTPYDEDEYAARLSELMDNPDHLAALRPGMISSTKKYSPENVAEKWDEMLKSI